VLDKATADDRANYASYGPSTENHSEILRSLSQRDDVTKDDLGDGDDATTANTLYGATSEQHSEVVSDRTKDGADSELTLSV
jgi:hypothetical protein